MGAEFLRRGPAPTPSLPSAAWRPRPHAGVPASYALDAPSAPAHPRARGGAGPRRGTRVRFRSVSKSPRGSRVRILLALLLVALVAGAVPVRPPASRGEKASGTAAWRAAAARPLAPRPAVDLRGFPPLAAAAPELLPAVTLVRADEPRSPRAVVPGPPARRSPLPRAPPAA